MQSVTKTLLCAAAAITLSLLTACGSGSGTTTPASIRMVNDTTASLTLSLNGAAVVAGASKVTTGYVQISPSTYTLSVASAGGSLTGVATTVGLGTAQYYTALAYERGNNVYSSVYTDNQSTPSTGYSSLDIANVSLDAGPLDVYLLPHGTTSLTGYQATFQSVEGLSTATTLASTASNVAWDIVVTKATSQSDVRLRIDNAQFASAQQYTLGLTATAGGGLVNGVLIPQGVATAVYYPSTQARVRVWSVLPAASSLPVLATIGSVALPVANSPSPTPYTLVDSGSSVTAMTVNGTAIAALPSGTFAAGGDYTVLVFGAGSPAGTPTAIVLQDTNQVISNYASVRLINGAVTGSAGLTLYTAGTEGANSVAYPTASTSSTYYAYNGVQPGDAVPLQLIGTGYTGTPGTAQFTSGSVYTVMVYDATLPPLISEDR